MAFVARPGAAPTPTLTSTAMFVGGIDGFGSIGSYFGTFSFNLSVGFAQPPIYFIIIESSLRKKSNDQILNYLLLFS